MPNRGRAVREEDRNTPYSERSSSFLGDPRDGLLDFEDWFDARAGEILQLAGDPIIVVNDGGRIVLLNRAAEGTFGYNADEVLGRPIEALLVEPALPADARSWALDPELAWPGRLHGRERRTMTGRRRDGREFPAEVTLTRDRINGKMTLVAVLRDVSARERDRAGERLLMREQGHRLKNVLATVQALARRSLHDSPDPEEFVSIFSGRIGALAEAHALLTKNRWEGAPLRDIVLRQLAPYCAAERASHVAGEAVLLEPGVAVILNMALHELATNAAKYGALSVPEGRVTVLWRVEGEPEQPRLALTWQEHDGPPAQPPERSGFGLRLIDRIVTCKPGGNVRLEFPQSGVRCRMEIPLRGGRP